MAKIIINVPDEAPVKYDLGGEDQLTVGRSPDNDIVIEHDSISGQHARFVKVDGQYHLMDSDSTNGTFADGVEAADVPLFNGVQIVFGSVPVDYECEEFAAQESAGEADEGASAAEEFAGGTAGATGITAEIAETSARPPGFKDMSPIEKIEKKDTIAQIAMLLGVLAIVAALALAVISFTL